MSAAPRLELRAIAKRFGSVTALDGASLKATTGTLHVVLGENGAGKTTLLRIAAGFLQSDAGEVLLDGDSVRWRSRAQALRTGIGVVEQHFSLVPAMTVAENVALAAAAPFSRFSPRQAAGRVTEIAAAAGLGVDPHAVVSTLGVAAQQRAEIVKALATNASLLILDEPTAVLSPAESDELFDWLRRFVSGGRTAIVITHRLREALNHGDALTVLRGGRTVLQSPRGAVSRDELVSAILGGSGDSREAGNTQRPSARERGETVVEVRDLSVRDAGGVAKLRDVSMQIRRGEIVGVAGVEGSGQRELLRVLAGRLAPTSGTISAPAHRAFIPEDRLRDALIGEMSLTQNLALRGLGTRSGSIDWAAIGAEARTAIGAFSVRASDEHQRAATLSGGNQQKFVLARELSGQPPLIVAENPTRGLDVRASADVMSQLAAARDAGAAVVVYSSDVEELVGLVDRAIVCFGGTVTEVPPDFGAIGSAMLGGK